MRGEDRLVPWESQGSPLLRASQKAATASDSPASLHAFVFLPKSFQRTLLLFLLLFVVCWGEGGGDISTNYHTIGCKEPTPAPTAPRA